MDEVFYQFHDPLTQETGTKSGPEITRLVENGILGADVRIAVDGEWRGFDEVEELLKQEKQEVVTVLEVDDRDGKVRSLMEAKRRWDWVEGELEGLRREFLINPGIRAETKAHIILDMEAGHTAINAVKLRAPDFVNNTGFSEDLTQGDSATRPDAGGNNGENAVPAGCLIFGAIIVLLALLWVLSRIFL